MKKGWHVRALADLCRINPPKSEARRRVSAEQLVSFIPMEDLGINQKTVDPTQARLFAEVVGSYTYFADDDVLMAKITPCFENGKLGIASGLTNGIGFGSSEYVVFRAGESIDKEWLYYFLSSEAFRAEGAKRMTGAVGHKRVAKDFIETSAVPVPPLAEQRRIAGILDEAFECVAAAKANAEANIYNVRALYRSQLQTIFERQSLWWPRRRLGEIASVFGRGRSRHRPRNDKKLYGGKYPFIQTGDVRNANHWIQSYNQTYNDDGLAQSKLWPAGTVCITIAANVAETAILTFDACFPDSVIGLIANERHGSAEFLEYMLQHFKKQLQRQGKGSAQANINLTTFETQRFPIPSLEEQKKIVEKLSALRSDCEYLESIYRQKLAALEALKKSLLYEAFSGNL